MEQLHQFVYPAIFTRGDDQVVVSFPDLGITTEGDSFEEAFLFAKDYLRVYCIYAKKFELDISMPSFFVQVAESNKGDNVMLVDTVLFPSDIK